MMLVLDCLKWTAVIVTTTVLATAAAVAVLRDYLADADLADVHEVHLPGIAAKLDTTGPRPQVWVNPRASTRDQAGALLGVMQTLLLGTPPAEARQVSRLHSVG